MTNNKKIFFCDNTTFGIDDSYTFPIKGSVTFDSTKITFDSTLYTFDNT